MARRRKRLGEAGWRTLLERFVGSGMTIVAFCREHGVSVASFHRWRAQLGGLPVAPGNEAIVERGARDAAFVDLGALAGRMPGGVFDLRVELGDGLVLHLARR